MTEKTATDHPPQRCHRVLQTPVGQVTLVGDGQVLEGLYGVALIYGYAGSMDFGAINEAVGNNAGNPTLLVIGMGMLTVGLLFNFNTAFLRDGMKRVICA